MGKCIYPIIAGQIAVDYYHQPDLETFKRGKRNGILPCSYIYIKYRRYPGYTLF